MVAWTLVLQKNPPRHTAWAHRVVSLVHLQPCGDSLRSGGVSTGTMTLCVLSAHAAADFRLSGPTAWRRVRRPDKERHKGKLRHVQQVESDAYFRNNNTNACTACFRLSTPSCIRHFLCLFLNKQAQLHFLLISTRVYHLLHHGARCPSGSFNLATPATTKLSHSTVCLTREAMS